MSGSIYKIEYNSTVLSDDIPAIPKTMQRRIRDAIEQRLRVDPVSFGKPLRYSLSGFRRLRVGDYRIVFKIENSKKTVFIIAIKHRKDVYE